MNISQNVPADIADFIHRFFWLVDHGRASETAEMFSADGALVYGEGFPQPHELKGEAIGKAMSAREKATNIVTRHVISNLAVMGTSEGQMDVFYLITAFRSEDQTMKAIPQGVIDVEESLVWRDGKWLTQRRVMKPVFV